MSLVSAETSNAQKPLENGTASFDFLSF